jgi:hypothetical protein
MLQPGFELNVSSIVGLLLGGVALILPIGFGALAAAIAVEPVVRLFVILNARMLAARGKPVAMLDSLVRWMSQRIRGSPKGLRRRDGGDGPDY